MIENLAEEIKKANAGNMEAMLRVVSFIVWEDESQPIDSDPLQLAVDYLNSAISQQNPQAMVMLGRMYENGRGLPQDYDTAFRLYTQAAGEGDDEGALKLGSCYLAGHGTAADMDKAYKCFFQSCILQNPKGYLAIGDMIMNGQSIDIDPFTAFGCYNQALELLEGKTPFPEYPETCLRIGQCLYHGNGIAKNLNDARFYLSEAVEYFKPNLAGNEAERLSDYRTAQAELKAVNDELAAAS